VNRRLTEPKKYAHDAGLVLGTNDLPSPAEKVIAVGMTSEQPGKPGLSCRSKGNAVLKPEGLRRYPR